MLLFSIMQNTTNVTIALRARRLADNLHAGGLGYQIHLKELENLLAFDLAGSLILSAISLVMAAESPRPDVAALLAEGLSLKFSEETNV